MNAENNDADLLDENMQIMGIGGFWLAGPHSALIPHRHACTWYALLDIDNKSLSPPSSWPRWIVSGLKEIYLNQGTENVAMDMRNRPSITWPQSDGKNGHIYRSLLSKSHSKSMSSSRVMATSSPSAIFLSTSKCECQQEISTGLRIWNIRWVLLRQLQDIREFKFRFTVTHGNVVRWSCVWHRNSK